MTLQEILHENLVTVAPLTIDDIPQLTPILEELIRDSDTGEIFQAEIDNILT